MSTAHNQIFEALYDKIDGEGSLMGGRLVTQGHAPTNCGAGVGQTKPSGSGELWGLGNNLKSQLNHKYTL